MPAGHITPPPNLAKCKEWLEATQFAGTMHAQRWVVSSRRSQTTIVRRWMPALQSIETRTRGEMEDAKNIAVVRHPAVPACQSVIRVRVHLRAQVNW